MRKIILVAALSLSLGGCAADLAKLKEVYSIATTATVPAASAQVAVSAFEVLEQGATEYFVYCHKAPADLVCAPGTKAAPGPLRIAIKYDRQGRAARDQIKAAGKSGALISSTAYNLLITAISNLNSTPVTTFGAPR